jgi:hypothetical protein
MEGGLMNFSWIRKLYVPLITVFVLAVSLSGFAQDQDPDQDQGPGQDPPDRVARLSYINGNVSFQPAGEQGWSQATLNYPLTTGDRIFTDRESRAELDTGNIAARLSANTDVTTTALNDQLVQLGIAEGVLRLRAIDIRDGNSLEIDTPTAALTVLRAGNYRVEVYPDQATTLITVNYGDLQIDGNGFSETLHSGQSVKLSGADEARLDFVNQSGFDDFDNWCEDRDRRALSSRSRDYVGEYVPGYSDLDEYGYWQSAPDYGQVWFPRSVDAGWVPYRYGHWAWVEPWGWTWVADEPWGFAPFHYGRWVIIGTRWGWIPGPVVVRPVYAPALVAFVGDGGVFFGVGVQCWFPLGPRDPYFPWYHHSAVYLRQVNVTNVTVRNITVVNNYINVRNAEQVHYAYQRVAPTAVRTDVFRSSQSVSRQVVRVNVDEVGRARVIPHPQIVPDRRAIVAGAPVVHPPVEQRRPFVQSRQRWNANDQQHGRGVTPDRGTYGRPTGGNPSNQNQAGDDRTFHGPGDRRTVQTQQPPPNANGGNPPNQNQAGDDRTFHGPGDRRTVQVQPSPTPNATPNVSEQDRGRGVVPPTGNPQEQQRGRPVIPDRGTFNRPGENPPSNANAGGNQGNGGQGGNNNGGQSNGNDGRARGQFGQRPLVTNAPPPPQNPSFNQRQPAMQDHPGRPLEPHQVDNLRQGQPAGGSHDREYSPHQQNSSPKANPHSDDRGKDDKGDKGKKDH